MNQEERPIKAYDLIVLGSGPAGQRAAVQAAKLEKSVLIVERRQVIGGVSLHTGTIPSKTLREAALYLTGWDQRGLYGRGYRLKDKLTADDLTRRLHITIAQEMEVMRHQLARNGVKIVSGAGSFTGPHTIEVKKEDGTTEHFEAGKILIAVGTNPIRPQHINFDSDNVVDSDGIIDLTRIPRSLAIIGAGVIGMEYASIFSTMDIEITLIDSRENVLGFMDRELVDELIHSLRERGVETRLGEKVSNVEDTESGQVVHLASGKRICAEMVLVAAGRRGCTAGLGLGSVSIDVNSKNCISVNEFYQTSVPHIYAAGDIVGFPSLAATAMEQGRLAACHAFDVNTQSHPELLPYGVYAVPEISMVGKTEAELTSQGVPYEVGKARLRETARGQILGLQEGLLKIIFSTEDQKILGVHIFGEEATELIHIGQTAMALGGTLSFFMENVCNYPTLPQAYKVAALDAWNRCGCR